MEIFKRKRRPVVAGLFALLGPGLGHLYCGTFQLAVVWLFSSFVISNIFYAMIVSWETRPFNIIVPVVAYILFSIIQIGHAFWTAKRRTSDVNLKRYCRWYYYLVWWLLAATIYIVFVPLFGKYQGFVIPVSSMEATLLPGDRLIVDMAAYESTIPKIGDVIVFIFPGDGISKYIKRCMAVPGDTVSVIDKKLYINGIPASEPLSLQFVDTLSDGSQHIQSRGSEGQSSRDNFGPYVVPQSHFFMMGDSRDNSYDSRFWGAVPLRMILGKAIRITYSPIWSRIGMRIE